MNWTTVPFGKYKDKSLPQIFLLDPDWFFYMLPKFYGRLADEAQDLARKARAIKIPGFDADKKLVEYWCEEGYPPGSSGFGFVDANSPCYNRWATRQHYLDLSIVCRASPYDKQGCRRLIQRFGTVILVPIPGLPRNAARSFSPTTATSQSAASTPRPLDLNPGGFCWRN
jgi:hypothetical protein